jgi:PAS domain S-box-containing protein
MGARLKYDLVLERQKAEEALRASEVRYRRLFETAQDGILILDGHSGLITDVNPFLVNLLDYSREEFIGKTLLGYWPIQKY